MATSRPAFGIGERRKEDPVDHAEERSVCADAQDHRHRDDGRERRLGAQQADGLVDVAHRLLDVAQTNRLVTLD